MYNALKKFFSKPIIESFEGEHWCMFCGSQSDIRGENINHYENCSWLLAKKQTDEMFSVKEEKDKIIQTLNPIRRMEEVIAERNRLRAFIVDLFHENDYPEYVEMDGFDFEQICIIHGILIPQDRKEGCGDGCNCEEMDAIDEKGFICNRFADWLSEGLVNKGFIYCKCETPNPYEESGSTCRTCTRRIKR